MYLYINFFYCRFAKRIAATDANQDLDLNNELFVMYGIGPDGTGAQALATHIQGAGGNPLITTDRVNIVVGNGDLGGNFPIGQLLRAHGILMLIAWPLLAVSGIFFAAWMRPALPNGEWFQVSKMYCTALILHVYAPPNALLTILPYAPGP